jgi:hypothetical protein
MPRPRAPWWIHLCAASFLGYFGLVMFSSFYPPTGLGIRIETTPTEGLIVASVIAGLQADRMGVQPGDRLVAINGRRLHNQREYSAFNASVSVGEERTWLFERSGGQFSVALAPRRRQFFPILNFLPVFVGLFVSLVFSFEPYDRDDHQLVTSVAASLALLLERRPEEGGVDEAGAECPRCGACDRVNVTRCAEDGTPLVRMGIPRVLGGRYTIHRRLGRGGMGTVYEARDGALERRVAVKVIRDDIAGSPDAADRFRREALVAASFAHPNVVTVYDFGITDSGRGYLVMERLNGATLRETLRGDGRLPLSRTLHVMRGVCQAVDAAHRRQLVHRDLKPENIFLTNEEVPKVLDFGIAKFVRPALHSTALTVTGAVVGTLGYMSPERIRGGAPNPSWDIWALAVVAYEMLAGRRPFADTASLEPFPAAAETWIRLTDRQPELPSALDSVFAQAFSLDPAKRPRGALILLGSLEQAVDG